MVILWLTQEFGATRGWSSIFPDEYSSCLTVTKRCRSISCRYISESSVAVFCGILPLILPNANPFQSILSEILRKYRFMFHWSGNWKYRPIVLWNDLAKNLSWGVVFLLGAGLAVASAFTVCRLFSCIILEANQIWFFYPSQSIRIQVYRIQWPKRFDS